MKLFTSFNFCIVPDVSVEDKPMALMALRSSMDNGCMFVLPCTPDKSDALGLRSVRALLNETNTREGKR
ncbi:hypothetical protein WBG78_06575 [Chryseolinea sp. T2]|uniref:hypothetical protein n=1 Tax=Chryseolinea sp. T2 TaxID=3129255 RepID=UPI003077F6F4